MSLTGLNGFQNRSNQVNKKQINGKPNFHNPQTLLKPHAADNAIFSGVRPSFGSSKKEIKSQDSNDHFSSFVQKSVEIDGKTWTTPEHYFQTRKFRKDNNVLNADVIEKIKSAATAKEAAALGQNAQGIADDWEYSPISSAVGRDENGKTEILEGKRYHVMQKALKAMFKQHDDLANELIETKDIKLEAKRGRSNNYNIDWGVDDRGNGKNAYGKILMQIRHELITERARNQSQVTATLRDYHQKSDQDKLQLWNQLQTQINSKYDAQRQRYNSVVRFNQDGTTLVESPDLQASLQSRKKSRIKHGKSMETYNLYKVENGKMEAAKVKGGCTTDDNPLLRKAGGDDYYRSAKDGKTYFYHAANKYFVVIKSKAMIEDPSKPHYLILPRESLLDSRKKHFVDMHHFVNHATDEQKIKLLDIMANLQQRITIPNFVSPELFRANNGDWHEIPYLHVHYKPPMDLQ